MPICSSVRLNKVLSGSGSWSRRGADAVIAEGRVTVNGVVATLGTQVGDGDVVEVDGIAIGANRKAVRPVYIALNKPAGIICTTERHVTDNIIDFVAHEERVFPIGRLDRASDGLILLTNDGDIVNRVLRSEHAHEKEYLVSIDREVTDEFLHFMSVGVQLSDALTRPCKIWKVGPRQFRIILTEGLNRQIRRMCSAHRCRVTALRRVRIMHIHLGNTAVGSWRNIEDEDLRLLLLETQPSTSVDR